MIQVNSTQRPNTRYTGEISIILYKCRSVMKINFARGQDCVYNAIPSELKLLNYGGGFINNLKALDLGEAVHFESVV